MANEFPHKHIIGYVHITPNIEIDKNISATDHSTYCASSIFGVYAKNGRQAIDVCAETGTTYINGVDPVAAYTYTYTAIPALENIINGKLNNYIKDHDVFHYGGTFNASNEQGKFGTFSYLKNDSMVIVGTTVKVQNDGWFGNYNVHAGDLLISYSDSATCNSTTYWDVIETHLGPLNSKGTYTQVNKPNFLTNIYLNDNGDLSYSYSYFTQVHSYVNNGTASDLDSLDNDTNVITTVVSNINFDASGKLSYQLHNLTNAKSHHSQQKNESVEQSVITNLSLSSRGHLTYTASVLGETSSTSGDITVGDTNNESFTLIDGINQSGNGSVSYHYKTITVSYKHHTNEGTSKTNLTFGNGGTDSTKVITNVNLSETGKLTYDYLTLSESQSHHTTNTGVKDSEKNLTTESSVKVISGVKLSNTGELSYSYYEIPQIKQTDNQVQKSLFMGDNNTTYMLSIDNGKIVIVQPIKSTSVSQGITESNTYSDGGSWLGASYDFSNYGLTVGTQQLIIQMGGTITTESIKDINGSSSNYSVSKTGDTFTISLSGANKQTVTTTPSKLTGNFTNIGNVVFKDSISAKDYNVRIEIDTNNILSKTLSLPARTKQQTVSVKANVYTCKGNPTSSNVTAAAVSSKPISVTFSSGGDIKYIFPEVFGTPTFKQLNAPDTNWELKSTVQYSTSSFSGTSNKVNYKVYGVKNATTAGGTWQISW